MARFRYDQADNYGSNGGSSFFTLRDDGDTARVRIMYGSIDDVEGLSVHEIDLNDKKRYVNCIREYNDPIDMCPLCKANYKIQAKLFVPLYNEDTGETLVWERGKKFFGKISDLCTRYDNLVSRVFEIVRHGKPKDTGTTYEIWPVGDKDNTTFEDLPEPVDVMKGLVLDKTADELNYYLRYHEFPDNDAPAREEAPRRREQSVPMRRTPARGNEAF